MSPESLEQPILTEMTSSRKKKASAPASKKVDEAVSSSQPETSPETGGEKSQAELRKSLESRFKSLASEMEHKLDEYDAKLEDGSFDDQEGEPEGSGEKRKLDKQNELNGMMERAKKMKARIDSKEPLPEFESIISTFYTYTNPETNKVERQETITLDIEEKLDEFTTFYVKTGIDLPPDFSETITDIWSRNQEFITEAIEKHGFDDILILPANIPLPDLAEKMKMGNGYYEWDNFKNAGSFAGAKSQNVDKPRIILVHKSKELTERPELASTLNTPGLDVKLDEALTLEDYLVFSRKFFEETGKHLDETEYIWTSTKAGSRLVSIGWHPVGGGLYVNACDLTYQNTLLGVRPSRSFY